MVIAAWMASCFLGCTPGEKRADLVFINAAEPEVLDPSMVSDQVSMRITSSLFEGLTRFMADGSTTPAMAESWTISPDKLVYTFTLRDGIQWSDGKPVTTEDFVYSWRRVAKIGSDYVTMLAFLKNGTAYINGKAEPEALGVKALDARHLEVTLENPIPFFLDLCAFQTFAPVRRDVVEKYSPSWYRPETLIGNGAFLFKRWTLDSSIRLEKNPRYWDAANVRLNSIEMLRVANENTALNYFLTGRADLMLDAGMLPPTVGPKLKTQPWFHSGPILGTLFIRFNTKKPPFNDPRIRRALSLAIDRKSIVEKVMYYGEPPTRSLTPPGCGVKGQEYQPPSPCAEYNPEEARRLLAEAGFHEGRGFPSFDFLYRGHLERERNISVELQSGWTKVLGLTVNMTKEDQKTWLASMRTLNYQVCTSSWVGDFNDPTTFLEMFMAGSGNNRTGWAEPAYDELINAAGREGDIPKRNGLFQKAETMLIRDQAVISPLYQYVAVQSYLDDKVGGVKSNLLDDHPFREMFIKK